MDVTRTRALVVRRRSPGRVRSMASGELHSLTHRLVRSFHDQTISGAQLWLLDCCIAELEYRARRARRSGWANCCRCELCWLDDSPSEGPSDGPGEEEAGDVL